MEFCGIICVIESLNVMFNYSVCYMSVNSVRLDP